MKKILQMLMLAGLILLFVGSALGSNWFKMSGTVGGSGELLKISMVDANTAYFVGQKDVGSEINAFREMVYFTDDRGVTVQSVYGQ